MQTIIKTAVVYGIEYVCKKHNLHIPKKEILAISNEYYTETGKNITYVYENSFLEREVSVRCFNVLYHSGINTIQEIINYCKADSHYCIYGSTEYNLRGLTRLHNMGPITFCECVDLFKKHNILF